MSELTKSEQTNGKNTIERLLSSAEAGEILGLSAKVVERKARKHEIPGFKSGRAWKFRASSLDAHITAQIESNQRERAQPAF
jgi:excisionase family DNA binding protein